MGPQQAVNDSQQRGPASEVDLGLAIRPRRFHVTQRSKFMGAVVPGVSAPRSSLKVNKVETCHLHIDIIKVRSIRNL